MAGKGRRREEPKGSKRCVLDLLNSDRYINKINSLIRDAECRISIDDKKMPASYDDPKEAEFKGFLEKDNKFSYGRDIAEWWLCPHSVNARTPNLDLISTCKIGNEDGILIVEAKAHFGELNNERKGKAKGASDKSKQNHKKIEQAISQANSGISKQCNQVNISIDKCYQLSNRIAHAWWLADHGIPVVVLYLGLLNVKDMDNGRNKVFKIDADWQQCFTNHSHKVGVDNIINKWIHCKKSKFILISKSLVDE